MTDREKLTELIGDAPVWHNGTKGEVCTQIADYLLANGVTFATDTNVGGKWISVEDKKPEEGGTYIVVAFDGHTKRVTFAKWQKRVCAWLMTGARSYWKVTHWMPLPEPPKEE